MTKKLIKMSINRHPIGEDMQKSKLNNKIFRKRMEQIEIKIQKFEDKNFEKFLHFEHLAQKIDDRVSESNQNIRTMKGDFKRLVQHNTDKISGLSTHIGEIDKFNNRTNEKN